MSLAVGTKLGPYEILAPIGAGGMGEVYRAKDTRLGRDVALKILPDSFARDADRLRRFEQEARAVATLNHPNILAIHDIGQYEGSPFLVSELLEGETLRAVLDRGALPQRKTIDYGVQISQGLAAAHEKGIVHRDLKPENVFVTKDGRIKILDFGLAKLAQIAGSDDVTLTSSNTAPGVVMGTASYMAPEQVRGDIADARTDIFAFGAVLYEMLSGVRAFRRDTAAETMTAVLNSDPPEISDPIGHISPSLDRTVRRCLEKNPEQRFQSARDLSFALSALSGTDTSVGVRAAAALAGPRRMSLMPWLVLAALALAAVAATGWWMASRPVPMTRMQFALAVPDEMSVSHMALSNDGKMLAFISPEENTGLPMLYLQRIGSASVTLLPGTENASFPFWSPDGSHVAYFANGKLQKMSIAGGTPQVLANVLAGRGGAWGSQNIILFVPDTSTGLWRVNSDGTDAREITHEFMLQHKEQQTHRWPLFLPDGKRFLYWAGNFANVKDDKVSGIYLSSLDNKDQKQVLLCHSSFGYDAHNLYYADDQHELVSVNFDPSSGKVSGSVAPVANQIAVQPSTYWAAIAISANGTLIYNTEVGAVMSALTWTDRSGKELSRLGEPGIVANPTLSPDGKRVAVDITDVKANNVDIWLLSTTGANNARFTFDPAEEVDGIWSPDGSKVAYRAITLDGVSAITKAANGLDIDKKGATVDAVNDLLPNSWSLDGKTMVLTVQAPHHWYLATGPAEGGPLVPLLKSPGNNVNGQISPDGKWIAYASDETGVWEVYVTTFPGTVGKWQVSRGGGTEPRWRGDGKEIYYIDPKGMLMAVSVNSQSEFATGTPTPLFQIRGRAPISSTDIYTYDVAKDGQRFLVNRYVKPEHVPPLTILLNTPTPNSSN
jgi:Tol biopolymer transport system component